MLDINSCTRSVSPEGGPLATPPASRSAITETKGLLPAANRRRLAAARRRPDCAAAMASDRDRAQLRIDPTRIVAEVPTGLIVEGLRPAAASGSTWQPTDRQRPAGQVVGPRLRRSRVLLDGGESAQMRAIRKHPHAGRQLPSTHYDVMGYWRSVAQRQPARSTRARSARAGRGQVRRGDGPTTTPHRRRAGETGADEDVELGLDDEDDGGTDGDLGPASAAPVFSSGEVRRATAVASPASWAAPTSGKSTLTNAIVGQKIVITSTNRRRRTVVRGIVQSPDGQLVLVEIPPAPSPHPARRAPERPHEDHVGGRRGRRVLPRRREDSGDRALVTELARSGARPRSRSPPRPTSPPPSGSASTCSTSPSWAADRHRMAEIVPRLPRSPATRSTYCRRCSSGLAARGPLLPDGDLTDAPEEIWRRADPRRPRSAACDELPLHRRGRGGDGAGGPPEDKPLLDIHANLHVERDSRRASCDRQEGARLHRRHPGPPADRGPARCPRLPDRTSRSPGRQRDSAPAAQARLLSPSHPTNLSRSHPHRHRQVRHWVGSAGASSGPARSGRPAAPGTFAPSPTVLLGPLVAPLEGERVLGGVGAGVPHRVAPAAPHRLSPGRPLGEHDHVDGAEAYAEHTAARTSCRRRAVPRNMA